VLVGALDFVKGVTTEIEWAVEGLIQRGGNGIVVGDPGSAKSFSTLDLAHHLVAGLPWMGHAIPNRMKVAYIAREDHAGLTQQRAVSLLRGYAGKDMDWALSEIELNEWLYFNTRAQSETFSLQNEMDVLEMIEAFKTNGIEIAFFDVFRRLWEGDENDNKEVAKVLAVLTRIQTECKCSVALVHHLNKGGTGTIFQRIRGSGATYGWRDWAFGISVENPDDEPQDRVRKIIFETKAGIEQDPVYYHFAGNEEKVILDQCNPPAQSYKRSDKKKGKDQDAIQWYEK
jgi:RecA-family ATPase